MLKVRGSWVASGVVHVLLLVVLAVGFAARAKPHVTFINLNPPKAVPLPPPPAGGDKRLAGRPLPPAPTPRGAPAPIGRSDSGAVARRPAIGGGGGAAARRARGGAVG